MDPLTIVSVVGNAANIVNIITKRVKGLREVHGRWKSADLATMTLISQLTALRAALSKISEWIQSDLAAVPQHHYFIMDLEQSVSCCYLVIKSMDSYMSKLDWEGNGTLERNARIRVVFQEKTCREFQEFIQRQTTALNILLSACNCKTASEQYAFLEKSANRNVFERIRDDSSSLLVLRDADSMYTNSTQPSAASSKLSRVFPFDTELTSSLVYQRAFRFLIQQPRANRQAQASRSSISKYHKAQAERKDPLLAINTFATFGRGGVEVNSKIRIAILGDFGKATEGFLVFLKMLHLASSPRKAELHRKGVLSVLFNCTSELLDNHQDELQSCHQASIDVFRQQTIWPLNMNQCLAAAILDIWQGYSNVSNPDIALSSSLPTYFLNNIHRVVQPSYTPTSSDLAHLPFAAGIQTIKIRSVSKGSSYSVLYPSGTLQHDQATQLHQFQAVDALIFAIDSCVDNEADGLEPALDRTKSLFRTIIKSPHLRGKPIILLFFEGSSSGPKFQIVDPSGSSPALLATTTPVGAATTTKPATTSCPTALRLLAQFRDLAQESAHPDKRDVIAQVVSLDEDKGEHQHQHQPQSDTPNSKKHLGLLRFIESTVNEMIILENVRKVVGHL